MDRAVLEKNMGKAIHNRKVHLLSNGNSLCKVENIKGRKNPEPLEWVFVGEDYPVMVCGNCLTVKTQIEQERLAEPRLSVLMGERTG